MPDFNGKAVLITGGGSGIGFATAQRLVKAGGRVTNTVDLSFPGVEGDRTLKVRMGQAFLKRVQLAATRDGGVTAAYMRAAGMVARPESLMPAPAPRE